MGTVIYRVHLAPCARIDLVESRQLLVGPADGQVVVVPAAPDQKTIDGLVAPLGASMTARVVDIGHGGIQSQPSEPVSFVAGLAPPQPAAPEIEIVEVKL